MHGTEWIDWTRTKLQPHEREDLLTALTSEQKEQLLEHDYVWVKGIGVLWKPRTAPCGAPGSPTEPTSRRSVGSSTSTPTAAGVSCCQRRPRKENRAMKVRPLHDRILVKRIEEEEKTKGGLIIPDTAKEKPMEGKVIAVGNGRVAEDGKLRPLDVHKGDRVLFSKYSGTEIQVLDHEHLIIREDDVLAVLE